MSMKPTLTLLATLLLAPLIALHADHNSPEVPSVGNSASALANPWKTALQ